MKRIIKRLFAAVLLLPAGLPAVAQQPPQTLEACIRHAIEHNIQLKQREQEQSLREIELNTSLNSWLPSLNAGIGQNLDFGRSPSKDGLIVDRNSANSSASLQLNMPVFDGFRISNDIAARRLNLQAAVEALNRAREDLAVGVASYFLQVLYSKEIRYVAELQVALSAEQVRRTEALVGAGKAPASQLYDIRAQQAKDEATLTEARNNVSLALLDLAQSLELEHLGSDFDIAAPEVDSLIAELAASLQPPELIYENAVAVKPQIREQEYLLESQKKTLRTAQSGYYPKLNLNASYGNGYYHYSGSEGLANIPLADQLRQNERKTVGLTLTVPIFSRFEVRNSVRSARVAIVNRELMVENAKKALYKEIQQAYFNATAAQEKYVASGKAVEAGREAFTYAEERYAAGKSSVFEYGEARTRYAQSLSEQAQAKYNFLFRAKILDFYNGKPITL
ncbi:MAG: TolC family protein [Tannerella sp.]|jgi:outer membrane protein|nr:TolC family protein [Tannerella sp.]